MGKLLIVDDVEINREILQEILQERYEIVEAENGRDALAVILEQREELSAVLLDLIMPEMDGFAVLEQLKEKNILKEIPVLVITGDYNVDVEKRCFDYGVADFISKPFNSRIVKRRVANMVQLYAYKLELEKKVEAQTAALRSAFLTLQTQADQLKKHNQEMIDMLGTVVEFRNLESGEHIQRVKDYTRILAEHAMEAYPEYGLTREKIDLISASSALHDIGKITIPDTILLKPGKLTKEEFEEMKLHTVRGCEILDATEGGWDEATKSTSWEICRHHHERYDGKGYPDGLAGEDIPLSAQLVSVADVYDALVNERCYKKAFSPDEAYRMIIQGECGTFSPKLMHVFAAAREEFAALACMRTTDKGEDHDDR